MNKKKIGIALSYVNTIVTALMNVILVPFLISNLGSAEYGVYKVINSFAGYLLIMDMGIGTIVTRYVSLYRSKNDEDSIQKSVATSVVVAGMLCAVVVVVAVLLQSQINTIYGKTFNADQLQLSHTLFCLMVVNICIMLITHLFSGYINAYEKFALTNGFSVARIIIRLLAVYVGVSISKSAVAIIIIDILINAALFIYFACYSIFKLKMRITIRKFDKKLVSQYALFSGAILFQSIVNQVNNSVDNVILGAMTSLETVAMYSSGLTIYGFYVAIPEAVNSVFLPQATCMFGEKLPDDDGSLLTRFVSRIGRYEAIICFAIIGGFISCGKDFVELWIGKDNIGAWGVALLLMIPVTIPMCENLMVTVLNACNKRMFRSVVLACVAAFNIVVTILLIPKLGYYGAAIGTCASIIIGHGIVLNIYYKKKFKLKIGFMLINTYLRVIPCFLGATIITVLFSQYVGSVSWGNLILKVIVFLILYSLLIFFLGTSKEEKEQIKKTISGRIKS